MFKLKQIVFIHPFVYWLKHEQTSKDNGLYMPKWQGVVAKWKQRSENTPFPIRHIMVDKNHSCTCSNSSREIFVYFLFSKYRGPNRYQHHDLFCFNSFLQYIVQKNFLFVKARSSQGNWLHHKIWSSPARGMSS